MLTRMLPARVIATVAEATELNAISQELDRGLLARLPRADGVFTVAEYCRAYRWPGDRAARERQIGLIGQIGAGLDDVRGEAVDPLGARDDAAPGAPRRSRRAARFSGAGLPGVPEDAGRRRFLATIDRRERELLAAIFAGENAPFAEPVSPERIAAIGAGGPRRR